MRFPSLFPCIRSSSPDQLHPQSTGKAYARQWLYQNFLQPLYNLIEKVKSFINRCFGDPSRSSSNTKQPFTADKMTQKDSLQGKTPATSVNVPNHFFQKSHPASLNLDLYSQWEDFEKAYDKKRFASFSSEQVAQVIVKFDAMPLHEGWLSESQEKQFFKELKVEELDLKFFYKLFPSSDVIPMELRKKFALLSENQAQTIVNTRGTYYLKMFSNSQFTYYFQNLKVDQLIRQEDFEYIASRLREVEIEKLTSEKDNYIKFFQKVPIVDYPILETLFIPYDPPTLLPEECGLRLSFLTNEQLLKLLSKEFGSVIIGTESSILENRIAALINSLDAPNLTANQFTALFITPSLNLKQKRFNLLPDSKKQEIEEKYGKNLIELVHKDNISMKELMQFISDYKEKQIVHLDPDSYSHWEAFKQYCNSDTLFAKLSSEQVAKAMKKFDGQPLRQNWLSATQKKEFFAGLKIETLDHEFFKKLFPSFLTDLINKFDKDNFALFSDIQAYDIVKKWGTPYLEMFSPSQNHYYNQESSRPLIEVLFN